MSDDSGNIEEVLQVFVEFMGETNKTIAGIRECLGLLSQRMSALENHLQVVSELKRETTDVQP